MNVYRFNGFSPHRVTHNSYHFSGECVAKSKEDAEVMVKSELRDHDLDPSFLFVDALDREAYHDRGVYAFQKEQARHGS